MPDAIAATDHAKAHIHLADYRAPAWRVAWLELELDIDPVATLVAARFAVVATAPDHDGVLRLDAEALELLEVCVDDRRLEAGDYAHERTALTLRGVPQSAVIATRVRIAPAANTTLQGLYLSGDRATGFVLTQCEAEGFRRITPFLDRPDVLTRYTVTLRAERTRFPLLLANGNADGDGALDDGRHWARFVDPQPKPSYLFAVVAGQLDAIEDRFVTAEGRAVQLLIHAEAAVIARCAWAMQCLKMAMRWDEERFGRCYDLDVFHIVATQDFAMGAMENKGLNIFNAKYLLADPEHATDDDYRHVLAVVGHEYFHNWSGNRVTCRDWFQLSLKEGLTVYREQEFESDVAERTLRRIDDVRGLWRAQFSEDAGPLAHPVRPDRYAEINNFYTATVYEKGAEIVRMLSVALGRDGFRRGLDRYFECFDGQAVTIEDFLDALGAANHVDLSAWRSWYAQAGTPVLAAQSRFDPATRTLELCLSQTTAPTPGQPRKHALPIPVSVALLDGAGQALPLRLDGETTAAGDERVLMLTQARATFRFVDVARRPVLSLLRGYSAPVRLDSTVASDDLIVLARHDSDGFNRWFAADTVARRLFAQALDDGRPDVDLLRQWTHCVGACLDDASLEPSLVAQLASVADAGTLADGLDDINPDAVHRARGLVETALATTLEATLLARYRALADDVDTPRMDPLAQGRRRLRNVCLAALCRASSEHAALAEQHFERARNLTDRLGALVALIGAKAPQTEAALATLAQRYADDAQVTDKWFALQATAADVDVLPRVVALTGHAAFRWTNPNNIYALLGSFALRNPLGFHRADGDGYRFIADAVLRIDRLTPQVAARLATAFGAWRRYEPVRRALMQRELQRMAGHAGNSADLADIVTRSLAT